MSGLTVFTRYDGQWNSKNEYVDFKLVGLLVPTDCNLNTLKDLVANAIQTSITKSDIMLQYQVDLGLPPVKLKKLDSTLTRLPLCITITENSTCENHVSTSHQQEFLPTCERGNLVSTSDAGSNSYIDKQDLPN